MNNELNKETNAQVDLQKFRLLSELLGLSQTRGLQILKRKSNIITAFSLSSKLFRHTRSHIMTYLLEENIANNFEHRRQKYSLFAKQNRKSEHCFGRTNWTIIGPMALLGK